MEKQKVRSQNRLRPGFAWSFLGVGERRGGIAGGPRKQGRWGLLPSREELRPHWPCPSPGTGSLEVQCVAGKWPDSITGKIKGAKLGLGLREVSQKGTTEGQRLDGRRGCWS